MIRVCKPIIWITRTQPAAGKSGRVWAEAGFEPKVLPLLDVAPVAHLPVPKDAVLIFTSKNGVDHMTRFGHRAVCVGDATAAQAEAMGFQDVVSVNGTSADVTHWVLTNLDQYKPVIHISGRHVRGRITEDLASAGYDAKRVIVYESTPVTIWPEKQVTHVAFYSPLAAKTFARQAQDRDLSRLTSVSISQATDGELEGLALKNRLIADHPTEAALVRAAVTA